MKFRLPLLLVAALWACTEYKLESSLDAEDIDASDEPDYSGFDTGEPADDPGEGESGVIEGRVCEPSGVGWVVGAYVYAIVDEDGDGEEDWRAEDSTDEEGRFRLVGLLPDRDYEVIVQKGSFHASFDVSLGVGTYELPEDECMLEAPNIAVITGGYDDIGDILRDVGLDFDEYAGEYDTVYLNDLLLQPAVLATYDIVFINCGVGTEWMYDIYMDEVSVNLRDFVLNGGSLYASDWAYYFVESTFPDMIEFYGDDTTYGAAQKGQLGSILATVVDSAMQTIIGESVAELFFDLDLWCVVDTVGGTSEVLLQATVAIGDGWGGTIGTVTNSPLAVRFQPSATSGRVIYTAFHNEHEETTLDMRELLVEIVFSL